MLSNENAYLSTAPTSNAVTLSGIAFVALKRCHARRKTTQHINRIHHKLTLVPTINSKRWWSLKLIGAISRTLATNLSLLIMLSYANQHFLQSTLQHQRRTDFSCGRETRFENNALCTGGQQRIYMVVAPKPNMLA
jgi:hypothetical protein